MSTCRQRRRCAVTLAEVLVVLAVVGVLAGGLLPVVAAVRRMAVRTACASNLGQVALAITAYASDHDDRLPADSTFGDDEAATSPAWFHRLPPYLGSRDVRGRGVFQCAGFRWHAALRIRHASPKSYKMNAYLDHDGRPRHYRLGSVRDESSLVLFVDAVAGETGMGQWGFALPAAVDDSRHAGVVNVLHADGHSRAQVTRPGDGKWMRALYWQSADWSALPPTARSRGR